MDLSTPSEDCLLSTYKDFYKCDLALFPIILGVAWGRGYIEYTTCCGGGYETSGISQLQCACALLQRTWTYWNFCGG